MRERGRREKGCEREFGHRMVCLIVWSPYGVPMQKLKLLAQ